MILISCVVYAQTSFCYYQIRHTFPHNFGSIYGYGYVQVYVIFVCSRQMLDMLTIRNN